MGQAVLMWGDQAGLELWVVDSRIWKLFPVSLMLAASCALLIEVGLTPFTACMLFTRHTGAQAVIRVLNVQKREQSQRHVRNSCTGTITP